MLLIFANSDRSPSHANDPHPRYNACMAENEFLMLGKVVADEAAFIAYLARLAGIAILVAVVTWLVYCGFGASAK